MATKPGTKSTEAKVYAQERIGEFMTTWKWRVPIDPTRHVFNSSFEVSTTVHKEAEWRKQAVAIGG